MRDAGAGSDARNRIDGIDGDPRGDFAGVVAAHAVGDHTEVARLVERPAVFVDRPDAALVGHTVRAQHTCVIGASRVSLHLERQDIWSSSHLHLVIVAQIARLNNDDEMTR